MEKSCTPAIIPPEVTAQWDRLRTRVMATEEAGRVKLRAEDVTELIDLHSKVAEGVEIALREEPALNDWYLRYVDRMKELAPDRVAPGIYAEDPLRFPQSAYFKKEFLQDPVITRSRYHWVDVEKFERAMSSIEKMWRARGSDERTMLFSALLDMQEEAEEAELPMLDVEQRQQEVDVLLEDERNLHALEQARSAQLLQLATDKLTAEKFTTERLNFVREFTDKRVSFWKRAARGKLTEIDLLSAEESEQVERRVNEHEKTIEKLQQDLQECREDKADVEDERQALTKKLTNEVVSREHAQRETTSVKNQCDRRVEEIILLDETQKGRIAALENQVAMFHLKSKKRGPAVTDLETRVEKAAKTWKRLDERAVALLDAHENELFQQVQQSEAAEKELKEVRQVCASKVDAIGLVMEDTRQAHQEVTKNMKACQADIQKARNQMTDLFKENRAMLDVARNLELIKNLELNEGVLTEQILDLHAKLENLDSALAMKEATMDHNTKLQDDVALLQSSLTIAQNDVARMRLVPNAAAAAEALRNFEVMKRSFESFVDDLDKTFTADIEGVPMETTVQWINTTVDQRRRRAPRELPVTPPVLLIPGITNLDEIKAFENKLHNITRRSKGFIEAVNAHVTNAANLIGVGARIQENTVQYLAKEREGLATLDEAVISLGVRLIGETWRAKKLTLIDAVGVIDAKVVEMDAAISSVEMQIRGDKSGGLPLARLQRIEDLVKEGPNREAAQVNQMKTKLDDAVGVLAGIFAGEPGHQKTESRMLLEASVAIPLGAPTREEELTIFNKRVDDVVKQAKAFVDAIEKHITSAQKVLKFVLPAPAQLLTRLKNVENELIKIPVHVKSIGRTLVAADEGLPLAQTLSNIATALTAVRAKLKIRPTDKSKDAFLSSVEQLVSGQTVTPTTDLIALEKVAGTYVDGQNLGDVENRIKAVASVLRDKIRALKNAMTAVAKGDAKLKEMSEQMKRGGPSPDTNNEDMNLLTDTVFGEDQNRGASIDNILTALQQVRTLIGRMISPQNDTGSLIMMSDTLSDIFDNQTNQVNWASRELGEFVDGMHINRAADATLFTLISTIKRPINAMIKFFDNAKNPVFAEQYKRKIEKFAIRAGETELEIWVETLGTELKAVTDYFMGYMEMPVFDDFNDVLGETTPLMDQRLENIRAVFEDFQKMVSFIEETFNMSGEVNATEISFYWRRDAVTKNLKSIMDITNRNQLQLLHDTWHAQYSTPGIKRQREVGPDESQEGKRQKKDPAFISSAQGTLLSAFAEFCGTLLFNANR